MYPRMCFKALQCVFPGLCVKHTKRLTENDKSGRIAT